MLTPDLIDRYRRHLAEHEHRAATTVAGHVAELQVLVRRGIALEPDALARHLTWLPDGHPLSPTTRNRRLAVLRGLVRYLRTQGLLEMDPLVGVKRGHVPRHVRSALTAEDVGRVIGVLVAEPPSRRRTRDATLLLLFYYTGLRLTELQRLDDGYKSMNQRCDAQSGALSGYSWCKKGKRLAVDVVTGTSKDGKKIADPVLGSVTCTGQVLGRPKGHDDICEVQYMRKVMPRRVVLTSVLVVEPKTAREREGRLKALVGAVASDYLEHLGRGELAPGIPAVDVEAVDPGCRPDPLMDATFVGETIKVSCVGKLGSFGFRSARDRHAGASLQLLRE